MKVVHIHRIRGIGGSERHLLQLLPALAHLGFDPFFVGLDDPEWDAEPFYGGLDEAGIAYARLRSRRDIDPALAVSLVRTLRRLRPAIVHTHLVHADVYGALAPHDRLFSTKHNDDPFRAGLFRFVERQVTRRAERVIAISEALARFSVERVGLPQTKVEVIHYGVEDVPPAWGGNPATDLPEGARVVLAVARLVEQKGLDRAMRAMPAIRARHPDVVLVALGEGPHRSQLELLAREIGVADAVRFPGRVPDVGAWLRRAEVLVHPVRWEGFGLAVLEAMAAGLPVVATRVSSIPELVVDGETGMIVQPEGLAGAVDHLLAHPDEARRLGAAGLRRARTLFSVERMARRTAEAYRRRD